jgi:hypothetical protein
MANSAEPILRDHLRLISEGWTASKTMADAAPKLLRESREVLGGLAAAGILVKGSPGAGNLAQVPWIAFLDPDVTESAQAGIYVVYLWSADAKQLYLCLSQGVTDVAKRHKSEVLPRLRTEAMKVRALISDEASGMLNEISLGSKDRLPIQYQAATIAAIEYSTLDFPEETQLRNDLTHFMRLYSLAVSRKRLRLTEDPESWETGLPELDVVERISEQKIKWNLDFSNDKAKPGGDIFFPVSAGIRRVTRRHVSVLESLRSLLKDNGWTTSSPHPFDLEAHKPTGNGLLIEVKVVRDDDSAAAVREAIGQLFDYQYSYRNFIGGHALVAAFSEKPDVHYLGLLSSLSISTWWYDQNAQEWRSEGISWR